MTNPYLTIVQIEKLTNSNSLLLFVDEQSPISSKMIETAKKNHKLHITTVFVNKEISKELQINKLPQLRFYSNGCEKKTFIGSFTEEDLKHFEKYL